MIKPTPVLYFAGVFVLGPESLVIMPAPVLSVAGVFVLGPGQQGILYEYREKEFGDLANTTDILLAVRKMRATKS